MPRQYVEQYSDGLLAGCYFVLNAALTQGATQVVIDLFLIHIKPSLLKMLTAYFKRRQNPTPRLVLGFYYSYSHITIATEILISSSKEVASSLDLVPEAQLRAQGIAVTEAELGTELERAAAEARRQIAQS
jgi:hypothetical protein